MRLRKLAVRPGSASGLTGAGEGGEINADIVPICRITPAAWENSLWAVVANRRGPRSVDGRDVGGKRPDSENNLGRNQASERHVRRAQDRGLVSC